MERAKERKQNQRKNVKKLTKTIKKIKALHQKPFTTLYSACKAIKSKYVQIISYILVNKA